MGRASDPDRVRYGLVWQAKTLFRFALLSTKVLRADETNLGALNFSFFQFFYLLAKCCSDYLTLCLIILFCIIYAGIGETPVRNDTTM